MTGVTHPTRVYFSYMGATWSASIANFRALKAALEHDGRVLEDVSAYARKIKRTPSDRFVLPLVGQEEVARLRSEARAKLEHADALKAYGDGRPEAEAAE